MDYNLLWFIVVLKIFGQVFAANNSYVILTPKTFRPGMKANLNVLILKEHPPGTLVDVNATLLINSVPIASASGTFHAGTLGSLQLLIPFQGFPEDSNRYNIQKQLRVTGSGGLTFNTTKKYGVFFNMKGFSIYVQTDKGLYKPSQTVRMRILAVYSNLQIHKSKMTVEITDPKNNKLASWKDLITPSGVVTRNFELSSQPNLGTWKITVEVDGKKEVKSFDVREYVLPKFKVDVLTNSYAAKRNGEIRGSVSAKYTYGKGVKGLAKVWVHFPCRGSQCDPHHQREFKLDGSHSFNIPEEEINDIYYRQYKSNNAYNWFNQVTVNASVTEELTGKTYFGATKVILRRTDVVLTFPAANPKSFKPNVPFQILLRATSPDNTPLVNQTVRVEISKAFKLPGRRPFKKNEDRNWTPYLTDDNGYIGFNLNISDDALSVTIYAETIGKNGEKETQNKYLRRFESPSKTYMQLKAKRYTIQAGEDIEFNMITTAAIASLNYLVLSKGNIILSNSTSYSPSVMSASLKIPSIRDMSPSASIVVYFVREDGEIIADSLKITVNEPFENMVSVKFSNNQTKPGEAVNINVKASPFSQVGLLAVDKSVLLLDKGNDFSVSQVMQELESYNQNSGGFFPFFSRGRRKRSFFFPWFPSGTTAQQIFQNAGVLVLTDSLNFNLPPFRRGYMYKLSRRPELTGNQPEEILSSKASNLADVTKVRSFFPETWLWEDLETNSSGHAQVQTKSPDTITSWILSGFAVSNETGFGVAQEKPKLRVFQPFFLSMDLPYSVIRGEQVAIKVIVFNYENEDMEVYVTLKASQDWQNINRSAKANDVPRGSSDVISVITVPANSGATVSFPIIPTKLGNIPVEISAQSTTSADAVRRNLLVEPEGIEQDYSYSLLLDMKPSKGFRQELELSLPSNMVEGSAKAMVSVIGDILGTSISGIEKLLRMPYGCGEQNMINFAPSMFIRAYLQTVGQLTPSIKDKSVRFMTLGYQRELTYQHRDGSYSAFGDKYGIGRRGSLWLTAFVVKSFSRARSFIYIDAETLNKSVNFILSTQQKDGSFKESGSVSSYLQGGLKSNNPVALTAYVTVSLLEYNSENEEVQKNIEKALKYLQANIHSTEDSYTLALISYTMELSKNPLKEIVLSKLLTKAVREDGTLYWTEDIKKKDKKERPWFRPYYRPRSADIEITSYALLVYAQRRDRQNGLAVARWLAQQRNSLGGYSSTQDTVIGLQALSEFAPLVFSSDIDFRVKVSTEGFSKSFNVDKNNMIVLQRVELPTVEGRIVVTGEGKGIGMLQIGVTYNVDTPPTEKSFNLIVKVITADKNKVKAQSCVRYTGDGENSGMAIMEFGLPSGFSLDQDDIGKLLSENANIKRIENPGRKSVLYFDRVSKEDQLCVNITSLRTHAVGKPQPIPVVVYDYYKPEKRAVMMYLAGEGVDLCDVCTDCIDCKKSCNDISNCSSPTIEPRTTADGSNTNKISTILAVFTTLSFMLIVL